MNSVVKTEAMSTTTLKDLDTESEIVLTFDELTGAISISDREDTVVFGSQFIGAIVKFLEKIED